MFKKKKVIIVGGGFGGLNAAKTLSSCEEVHVLLVDQKNYHLFQPLLYQVATAGLNGSDIAVPIRSQFSRVPNVQVQMDVVVGVNFEKKIISLKNDALIRDEDYDFLILACGAQHSYFNHPEWEQFAPGLKTLEQATEIRRRILLSFEKAENQTDLVKQEALMTFVVIGGGPTGVELAGAIADISRTVLIHDFKKIDPSQSKIILLEAGPRLLSAFTHDLSRQARFDLMDLGVEVRLNSRVDSVDADGVRIQNFIISSKCVIWAAGVQAAKLSTTPEVKLDRAGRLHVESDLSVPGFPDSFVIGDMAAIKMSNDLFVPGLAPAAIQEGIHVAQMIQASIYGHMRKPFVYRDKGQSATIGRNKAVLQTKNFKLSGYFAWLAWLFIHIFYLVGFKNRVSVMFIWAWSYLRSKRGVRTITEPSWLIVNPDVIDATSESSQNGPVLKQKSVKKM